MSLAKKKNKTFQYVILIRVNLLIKQTGGTTKPKS